MSAYLDFVGVGAAHAYVEAGGEAVGGYAHTVEVVIDGGGFEIVSVNLDVVDAGGNLADRVAGEALVGSEHPEV